MNSIQRFNPFVAMACILALVITLVAPMPAMAGTPKAPKNAAHFNWDNVLRLTKGQRIVIVLFSQKAYRGKVERVEPNAIGISLEKKQGSMLISKEDIQTIVLDKHLTALAIGIGAAAGGSALMASAELGSTVNELNCVNGSTTTSGLSKCTKVNYSLVGAGAGIAIGGLVGALMVGKPKFVYYVATPPAVETTGQVK